MWKTYVNTKTLLPLFLLNLAVCGQGYTPSRSSSNNVPDNGVSAPSSSQFESNTFQQTANKIFDPSSDSMDFESGSYQWKGGTFNLSNQRAFRARFERFLLGAPAPNSTQYTALMQEITDLLSIGTDSSDATIKQAWQLLFEASEFEQDGGNSTIVANQVFNAWRIRQESRGLSLSQKAQANIRADQQEVIANRSRTLRRLQERQEAENVQAESSKSTVARSDSNSEMSYKIQDLLETEATIARLQAQSAVTGMQAMLQFQSQIVTFLMQRRFQHAQLLSNFYQLIFKGGSQKLEVGDAELMKFLPNTDLTFTVDTLSFMSREAVNDVTAGVDAILAADSEGRRLLALERVQETFFLGEHLSALDRISVEQRRVFLDLYRTMLEAQELADAKDFQGVSQVVAELALLADDFPVGRVQSAVDSAMSMSDMAVFAATQYRNSGQLDETREELMRAIEIWPSNPSITDFQRETTRLTSANSKGVSFFDDLFERSDRRGIYQRRMELGFALADDAPRKESLMNVIDQVARLDLLIAQAKELTQQGESFAAWELLEAAREIDEDDAPMNRARADLAPRVAGFIGYVDRAVQSAASADYAAALTSYLWAQDIYPASRTCRIGIDAMSESLMSSLMSAAEESYDD